MQVVPDIDDSKEDKSEVRQCLQEEPGADRMDDFFQNITQQVRVNDRQEVDITTAMNDPFPFFCLLQGTCQQERRPYAVQKKSTLVNWF